MTDAAGNSDSAGETLLVRKLVRCRSDRVAKAGSWRQVRDQRANGGSYCRNDDDRRTARRAPVRLQRAAGRW